MRAHHLQLPLALGEADHLDVVGRGVLGDGPAEPQPDLLQDRRGRDREPQVAGQEVDHLPRDLQVGHPPVEVDPVEALQIQSDMPIQDVVHGHHAGRHRMPPGERRQRNPASLLSPNRDVARQPTTTSAVRGEACDTRSHVVSGLLIGGPTDVDDVAPGQCSMTCPRSTCVAGNGGVRSSGESPRAPVPSGGHRRGEDRTGERE